MNTKSNEEARIFLLKVIASFSIVSVPDKKCDMKEFTQMNCCDRHREERTNQNALEVEAVTFGVKTKAKFGTKHWMIQFMNQYGLEWPSDTPAALMVDGNDY